MIEQIISKFASLKLNSCGIAVSGGSDSMALLHILTDWESASKPNLLVASIDHGLRPESKSEVEFVKKICQEKKVEHVSLAPATNLLNTQGNLQANARSERFAVDFVSQLEPLSVDLIKFELRATNLSLPNAIPYKLEFPDHVPAFQEEPLSSE